jgi:hypothetical protein
MLPQKEIVLSFFLKPTWVSLIFWCLLSSPSIAQKKAFSVLDVRFQKIENISNKDAFFRYWKPGSGFSGSVKTPFYLGKAELGLEYHHYPVITDKVPEMVGFFIYSGWTYPLNFGDLSISPGVRIGNYRMIFDDKSSPFRSESDESEFSTGFTLDAQYLIASRVGLNVGISHTTVHTYNKLYNVYIGGGLVVRIKASDRLSRLLSQ